jgi:hypothetical protein
MAQQFYSYIDPQENWKGYSNIYTHVYGSTIHNRQKVEIIQMSINKWIYKQIVVYTYNTMEYYSP